MTNDKQPTTRPVRSMPTREAVMLEPGELYLVGTATAVIMAMLGGASGLVTLVLSGNQRLALAVAATAFMLAGVVLAVRLWRVTRAPAPSAQPPT